MGTFVVHHFFSAARMKPTTKGGRVGAAGSDPHSWVSLEAAAYNNERIKHFSCLYQSDILEDP